MVSKKVKITCEYGLHMLPSVMISDRLSKFYECKIWINYKGKDINAKNVVDLMANYLKKDSEVRLQPGACRSVKPNVPGAHLVA